VLGQSADTAAEAQNQLVGLIDLLALAAVTGIKAGLAVKHMPSNIWCATQQPCSHAAGISRSSRQRIAMRRSPTATQKPSATWLS
jgi:hypothetical protein